MAIVIRSEREVKAAVYGGALLGGGGGGSLDEGYNLGLKALEIDRIKIYDVNELPDDTTVITVSAVGAPAAEEAYLKPNHLVRAVELIKEFGVEVGGLITAENGGFNTVNGWYQSVKLGLPLLDAACDGRAHPTGLMGAMGLHKVKNYISIQAAAGGDPSKGQYLEVLVRSSLSKAASMIRKASVEAGGVVGVARNPVRLDYIRKNAAIKAITLALNLGYEIIQGIEKGDIYGGYEKIAKMLDGELIDQVKVIDYSLKSRGGFDIGHLKLKGERGEYEIVFVNEYMLLDKNGQRIATFPDLISLIDVRSGRPITSADVSMGSAVLLLTIPRSRIPLGSGLLYSEVYKPIEDVINRPIIQYIKDIIIE